MVQSLLFARMDMDWILKKLGQLFQVLILSQITQKIQITKKFFWLGLVRTLYFSCAKPNWISSTLEQHWRDMTVIQMAHHVSSLS